MSLTYDALAALVGQEITVTTTTVPVVLTLTQARPNPEPHPGGALDFTGPLGTPLAQGSYPVAHADLGQDLLFLVPVGRTLEEMRYEAIFG